MKHAILGALALTGSLLPPAAAADAPFQTFIVPALSSLRRLPDSLPEDARPAGALRFVAAQGEFEPASFLLQARTPVKKLEMVPTALTGSEGGIPAEALDIKVVKVWFQAGTAWYSYFGDSNRRELTPELLLNDETLIEVDEARQENYLRVGNSYQWVSYRFDQAEKAFNYLTEPVADSPTLQPVRLEAGRFKQFWVTLKVPEDTPGGVYRGEIRFTADGKKAGALPVEVRVLPFTLPRPKTYYDLSKDYMVTMYAASILNLSDRLNIPVEITEKRQKAIYRNLLDHNVFNHRSERDVRSKDLSVDAAKLRREIEMIKEAGFVTRPLMASGWSFPLNDETPEEFRARIDMLAKTYREALGHDDVYVTSWDEAGVDRIKIMRDRTEYTNEQGLELWVTTAAGKHFDLGGYVIEYANHGGRPQRDIAQQWHALGSKVASYAGPHTGPENPDIFRRWEGLARYKALYDGSYNYKYFSQLHPTLFEKQKANVWNDFLDGQFRGFNLVHPTSDGVIDTLAWEGFREGIDDVRYATKLKEEADKAIRSGNVKAKHAARKALMWLELLDDQNASLDTARQEMIEYILKIQDAMKAS